MLTRRTFLGGLGLGAASTLFSPFLHALDPAGTRPRRFVVFVEGNGIEPRAFLSKATLVALEALKKSPITARYPYLRDYRQDAALPVLESGLHTASALETLGAMASNSAVLLGLSSKVAGGGHSTNYGALSCTKAYKSPTAPSIDAVLSSYKSVRQGAPFDAIRLGVGGPTLNYATCARGKNDPAPLLTDPIKAFDSTFGSLASSQGAQAYQERRRLLDFAQEDVKKVQQTFASSSSEAVKLERYLQAIEAMNGRIEQLASMEDALKRGILAVDLKQDAKAMARASEDPLERMRAQVEIATAALIGNVSNVVVFGLGTGDYNWAMSFNSLAAKFPGRKVLGGHDMKHGAESGNAQLIDVVHSITRTNVSMLAQMATTLEATEDTAAGDGSSMLENTLILYMSDNGEKHHSNAEEWPVLLMGGKKMGFATDGRTVVYPRVGDDNNARVSNLFNTLSYAAGKPMDAFGTESSAPKGPLGSEIWSPPL